jgi:NAD-dependent deacetylase
MSVSHSDIAHAIQLLQEAKRVVVLTGAGVSAESGVPTFRDSNGLWEGHRVEDVATPRAFQRNPDLVWRFYNQRRENLQHVSPNPGHYALAELERLIESPGQFTLITQNVDGLHRRAGSRNVLEIHGNISRTRCTGCGEVVDQGLESLPALPRCANCSGLLRPDIVWFEEMLPEDVWAQSAAATAMCDLFLAVGTSAVVYPAAGLIAAAKNAGAHVIEVNRVATTASSISTICLHALAGELLPQLVDGLRKRI